MTVSNVEMDCSQIRPDDTKSLSTIYAENPTYQALESPYVGLENLNDKIHVQICDVTKMAADAIVCSTRTDLTLEPVGICKRVWGVGGSELKNACQNIGACDPGKAFLTYGYILPAKYVLFTAGPPPDTTLSYAERRYCLRKSYLSCLEIVKETPQIKSVAFPCLGAGGAGIELSTAIGTAVRALREWLTTADNAAQVDTIILCIYDEYQWSNYLPLLIKTFPFPKGNTDQVQVGTSTNILCYKYKKSTDVTEAINERFGQLVETLRQTLSCPKSQTTSRDHMAILELKKIGHTLQVHHNVKKAMLEFQMENITPCATEVDIITCSETQAVIEDFLETNFDNLTPFAVYIRCAQSRMGDRRGLWKLEVLLARNDGHERELHCPHPHTRFTHTVDTVNMLQYWKFSKMNIQGGEISADASSCRVTRPVEERSLSESSESQPTTSYYEKTSLYSRRNIDTIPRQPRELDQVSWGSSIETSSSSENATESEGGIFDTGQTQPKIPTPILSSISGVFRKGMQRLRSLTTTNSSSSSGNETETSACRRVFPQEGKCGDKIVRRKKTITQNNTGSEQSAMSLRIPEITSSQCLGANSPTTPTSDDACKRNCSCSRVDSDNVPKDSVTEVKIGESDEFGRFKGMDRKGGLLPQNNCLCDKTLLSISRHIGNKQKELGIELGLLECEVQRCLMKAEGNFNMFGLYLLKKWRSKRGNECRLEDLFTAMDNCDIDTYHVRNSI